LYSTSDTFHRKEPAAEITCAELAIVDQFVGTFVAFRGLAKLPLGSEDPSR
jgi:hypothetical protein